MNETTGLSPTPFQARVAMIPESFDLALLGGRGGGKSWALAWLILRHVEQYGDQARVLYIRRTYAGLRDFEAVLRELFFAAYGPAARYNSVDHLWSFRNGATVELGQLETARDYQKYQGRSFTMLVADEVTQYPDLSLLDLLRSNLRARAGVPIRVCLAGNPGGVGHSHVAHRFVFNGSTPWAPYLDEHSGRRWVTCPSVYADNPQINQEDYRRQLEAACSGDPDLLKAWLTGDWSACVGGSFFGGVIADDRVAIDPEGWTADWFRTHGSPGQHETFNSRQEAQTARARSAHDRWSLFLSHDYGSAAPSATYICAESPGAEGPDGRWYARGSVLLLDELYSCDPTNPHLGLRWTVPVLAERIRGLCDLWGIDPVAPGHVADDACFARHGHAAGSIANEFLDNGVTFHPAKKGTRVAGWESMRAMLEAAGDHDRPGLYVSRRCVHWWRTVPFLARDLKNVEDLDTRSEDHAADSCRYALCRESRGVQMLRWYV